MAWIKEQSQAHGRMAGLELTWPFESERTVEAPLSRHLVQLFEVSHTRRQVISRHA